MRKSSLSYLALLFVAVIFASCGGLKKMSKNAGTVEYVVTPKVLEMHADSVEINITGKYPVKYFNKKAILEITPVLKYDGGEKAYKAVKVQGEKVEDNYKVISYTEGGSFSYTDVIPYNDGMKISDLEVKIKGIVKSKELIFDAIKISDGVIATPALVIADAKPIIGKDNFKRIITETKEADIHFAIQQANVRGNELRAEDIKELKKYIAEARVNERKEFKGVSVSAYASPDGAQDLNTRLAENRAKVATKVIDREFRKVEKAKEEGFVATTSTPEDWAGFKKEMEASDIADKALILRVLEMHSDLDVREKEIKNIAAAFLEIADKILPKLRRSQLTVNVDLIGYSDEEIVAIFNVKPDSLNVEELLYAATLSEELSQKINVYKTAIEIYANDWRGFNNLGLVYVQMNKISDAKQAFENAKKLEDNNTIVINNLGVIAIMENDVAKAEELFTSASGAGEEVNYNLGIVNIKKADYEAAVRYFGQSCSFNAALAKVLAGDNDGAIKTVDCADNKDEAMMYYIKAVAGVRKGDSDIMFNNLRSAVSKDASLGAKAKMDMEFAKFFHDDTFKAIVK